VKDWGIGYYERHFSDSTKVPRRAQRMDSVTKVIYWFCLKMISFTLCPLPNTNETENNRKNRLLSENIQTFETNSQIIKFALYTSNASLYSVLDKKKNQFLKKKH
jgi:hypothetical protein